MTYLVAAGSVAQAKLNAAIVRIHNAHGHPVGMGFLIDDTLVLTCAHVVSAALGLAEEVTPTTHAQMQIDLPLLDGCPRTSGRVCWWAASIQGDIALLRLDTLLAGAKPIRLKKTSDDVWGHQARVFGIPASRPGGVWHSAVLRAPQNDGWIELDMDLITDGYPVSPGFSGSPVWDNELAGVVGMMAVVEANKPAVSYLIPTEKLVRTCPELGGTVSKTPSQARRRVLFWSLVGAVTAISCVVYGAFNYIKPRLLPHALPSIYQAGAPGPGCDNGGASWTLTKGKVTCTNHRAVYEDAFALFRWPGRTFARAYEITLNVEALSPETCVAIVVRGGYSLMMCAFGLVRIDRLRSDEPIMLDYKYVRDFTEAHIIARIEKEKITLTVFTDTEGSRILLTTTDDVFDSSDWFMLDTIGDGVSKATLYGFQYRAIT